MCIASYSYLHLALTTCNDDPSPLPPAALLRTRSATKASRSEREGDLAMNRRELIFQA